MSREVPAQIWAMRMLFPALALLVIFFHLLPVSTDAPEWAGPDLILVLGLAFAMRRPELVPAISVAAIGLLADLLLHRPPGLMALLLLLGVEQLRTRASILADIGFAAEWASAALVIIAVQLIGWAVLGILLVEQAAWELTAMQIVLTVASYPLVVVLGSALFGLRRRVSGPDESKKARV